MTDDVSIPAATAAPAANKGVKRGLPATGLPTAEDAAGKLWHVARLGTTKQDAFAAQWGKDNKASGGAWARRMALLRGFGLLRFEDEEVGLSELGQKLVNDSDPAAQRKARQAAVMTLKAYRELVEDYDGTALPDASALASRLRYEYGKSAEFAKDAAEAFIASLRHADMIDQSNAVRSGGRPTTSEALVKEPELAKAAPEEEADEIDRAFEEADDDLDEPEPGAADETDAEPKRGFTAQTPGGAQLSVSLDLSNFRADEVIQILNVLGFSGRG